MTTAVDDSGAGHDGTYVNNPTSVAGLLGSDSDTAISFAQTSAFATQPYVVSNDALITGSYSGISLEAIVNVGSPGAGTFPVICGIDGTGADLFELATFSGDVFFNCQNATGVGWALTASLGTGRHHVVGTYDGASARLWVDGSIVDSTIAVGTVDFATSYNFYVATDVFDSGGFDGVIDEVALYLGVGPPDVAAQYAAIDSGSYPASVLAYAPTLYWRLGDPLFFFTPIAGSTAGGTTVVLTGSGFTGATAVTFDGIPVASFVVDSDTQITVVTPPDVDTFAPVTVTLAAGSFTYDDYFRYHNPPVVDSLTPSSGPTAGGTTVVIAGLHHNGVDSVTFGGTSASFVVDNDNQTTATAPAHAAGTVQVILSIEGVASA